MTAKERTERRTGWTATGWAVLFWLTAGLGAVAGFLTWLFLYLASDVDNRSTADDFSDPHEGAVTLGLPVVVGAHLLGLLLLLMAARVARHDRRSAVRFALVALVATSLVGLAGLLALTGGDLLVPYPQPFRP